MNGDLIDLEPALRDAVVLALPLRPAVPGRLPGALPRVRGPARGRTGPRARRSRPPVGGSAAEPEHDRST